MLRLPRVLALAAGTIVATATVMAADPVVTPVASVDLDRYSGRWFEIARYPNRFQKNCAGDTVAEYARRPDGKLTVTNRCRRSDGSLIEAVGLARPRDAAHPDATFKVRFAPAFLSFIPQVWGDYWILGLPADYRYVVVGEPSREYLWILSRTPQMSDEDYQAAVSVAVANGYASSRLVRTPQAAP